MARAHSYHLQTKAAVMRRESSSLTPPDFTGALCAEIGPQAWDDIGYPESANSVKRYAFAKRICASCPIRQLCLQWAMTFEEQEPHAGRHGVFGGLSPSERQLLALRAGSRRASVS